ncbi:FAD-binding oxidoreductase [Aspergillus fischeri NRRL 181]|uniref:FAD binding domain protein n=1 Tax=Neosartorya fischeri (strain ATCC 1020 / DSM 3700 / CBS 544.65 / FGSC A1164 / JCM 1740 / NRRL 181 / WB 181) TaxID=331117 RepID=A1D1F7_NEOFI|nr:FAD binding domain protein [Aspergillus fischeri NRRL 181]EAW22250.1 FAD binding domain protein [Aspergillus fischeri NRRL 181]
MLRVIALLAFFLGLFNAAACYQNQATMNQTASVNCQYACSRLSAIFRSALHYPDRDNFTIWDAKQQEARPACRVEPSNATDVSRILDILVGSWCHFSVKGGGHSRNPGDSNSQGGVTLDLGRLNSVEIMDDGARARVGGGANSAQVYRALESQKLSFVGGRVGTVGVGGFSLGGGTSPLSNKHGWALDNIYEYEVVLANGTITTASETHNPDLYYALRGGGNNFGIVTNFVVRTFPQGPVFTGMTSYAANQSEQVLDRVYDLYTDRALTSDVEMGYDLYYTYDSNSDEFILMGAQRYGKPVENPKVFHDINQIPTLSRNTFIGNLSSLADDSGPMGTTRIEAVAKELKVADRYLYINYASAAQADKVFAGYGEKNWQRLRDIQRSVDPRGIFTSKGLWKGFVKLL